MNVLKQISLFILIIFSSSIVLAFNACNVDVNEPWFLVESSSGNEVFIVDKDGDIYFGGRDHILDNKNDLESFEVGDAFFNSVTSKFISFNQNLTILPETTNSLIVRSSTGINVSSFDENGNVNTMGIGVYQNSQAKCMADGIYCNGNFLEDRDYFCDIIGSKIGFCDVNILSSIDCTAKITLDTDGGYNIFQQGTVTDYTSCALGDCKNDTYTDYCSDSLTLIEYSNLGVSFNTNTTSCSDENIFYCAGVTGLDRYERLNKCTIGRCEFDRNMLVETCVAPPTDYSLWTCFSDTRRKRTVTTYSQSCDPAGCPVASSTDTDVYENAPVGEYCSGGDWIPITYSWITGSWGSCSVSCGGGIQTRPLQCIQDFDGAVVSSTYCNPATKPVVSKVCNTVSCCTDSTWSPATSTVCNGVSFTQTSNCGATRLNSGTKNCACTLDGVSVADGASRTFYSSASVTCGNTCSGISRTCNAGALSGSSAYNKASCSVGACCAVSSWTPATGTVCSGTAFTQTSNCGTTRVATGTKSCSCVLDGVSVADGTSRTFYNSASVTCGNVCSGTPRTCTDGVLGGSATYNKASCSIGACCVASTWTPSTSTVCSGTSFTQTSNCGTTRSATGTKSCCVANIGTSCMSGCNVGTIQCDGSCGAITATYPSTAPRTGLPIGLGCCWSGWYIPPCESVTCPSGYSIYNTYVPVKITQCTNYVVTDVKMSTGGSETWCTACKPEN